MSSMSVLEQRQLVLVSCSLESPAMPSAYQQFLCDSVCHMSLGQSRQTVRRNVIARQWQNEWPPTAVHTVLCVTLTHVPESFHVLKIPSFHQFYTLKYKGSLLASVVPQGTFNFHVIFPLHRKFFIVKKKALEIINLLFTQGFTCWKFFRETKLLLLWHHYKKNVWYRPTFDIFWYRTFDQTIKYVYVTTVVAI